MSKNNMVEETNLENIESSLNRAEQFIENNKKIIAIALVLLVALIAGVKLFDSYVVAPNEKAAHNAMFQAQYYFEQDSLALALKGDGENLGFIQVANDFSGTKAGNLANYYAGICHLNLGEFDKAIDAFEDFSSDDDLFKSLALGLTGDAYSELKKYAEAINFYEKAVSVNNSYTAPKFLVKAAVLAEKQGNKKQAIDYYTEVKNNFPKSVEAREALKQIEFLK